MATAPHLVDGHSCDFGAFLSWAPDFADPYSSVKAAVAQSGEGCARLPEELRRILREFHETPYAGALLIRNLPLPDPLPQTPTSPFVQTGLGKVGTEALLFSIASILGSPYSYREWEAGLLVHNKYPIRAHAKVQYGSNSVLFRMHTETPFRDFSPDYVCLLCVRGDPKKAAATYLCDIRDIIATLPADIVQTLRLPLYAFQTDNALVVKDNIGYTIPRPIVLERDRRVIYEYVDDLCALTENAQRSLDTLRSAVHSATIEVRLQAGELLIIDNSHMVHGRSAYRPNYDGSDRWLQRLLISNKLDRAELSSSGHLISDSCISGYSSEYRKVLEDQFLKAATVASH